MKSISKLVAAETLPEVFVLLRVTPKRCSQWLPPQRSQVFTPENMEPENNGETKWTFLFQGLIFSGSMLYFQGVSWVASFSVTSIRIISLLGNILHLQLTGGKDNLQYIYLCNYLCGIDISLQKWLLRVFNGGFSQ